MFNAVKDEVQPILSNFRPMQQRLEASQTEADTQYQKLENLGVNAYQRIHKLTNDIDNRMKAFETTLSATRDTLNHMTA